MNNKSILIPVDFSEAADTAIVYAIFLAKKMNCSLNLLHVFEDEGISLETCEMKLKDKAGNVSQEHGIPCDCICEKGDIFKVIPEVSSNEKYCLMVLATHGARGFRQKVFGPDILKLLRKVYIPSIVVQKESRVPDTIQSAILPVGGHDEYDRLINAITIIAGPLDPEVKLYSIVKPGFEQTEKLRENIKTAETKFSEKGIRYERVAEDQNVFSVGFAKQTLKYAEKTGADLIAIMANATKENYYFADSDKQAVLTNKQNIPVLSVSNADHTL